MNIVIIRPGVMVTILPGAYIFLYRVYKAVLGTGIVVYPYVRIKEHHTFHIVSHFLCIQIQWYIGQIYNIMCAMTAQDRKMF